MTTQQQIIHRLAQSRRITSVRQDGDTVHYTFDGKPFRIEQAINPTGAQLRLSGPRGILHVSVTADDMCDFILA